MGTHVKYFGILIAGLIILQAPALAEMIQGQVIAVNPDENNLTLQRVTTTGDQEQIDVSAADAQLRGIQSLDQVEVGDEIRADANKPAFGMGDWEATWIEKSAGAAGLGAEGELSGMEQQAGEGGMEQEAGTGAEGSPAPSGAAY